jgi:hypothetical protein
VSRTSPARDPRRSLITGTIIAGVVLAVLALIVLIGTFIVFYPRRGGRDSMGPLRPAPAIHLIDAPTS